MSLRRIWVAVPTQQLCHERRAGVNRNPLPQELLEQFGAGAVNKAEP